MKVVLKWVALSAGVFVIFVYLIAFISMPRGIDPATYERVGGTYNVEIIRDKWGVPHVYGKLDPDVSFGLAFAHSQDDFATIQDVILATRGLMSTRLGMDGIPTDFLVNFMNGYEAVDDLYKIELSPQVRAIAEAYADGVNHYVSLHGESEDVSPYLLPVTGKDIVAGYPFKTPLFYGFDKVLGAVYEGSYDKQDKTNQASANQTDGLTLHADPMFRGASNAGDFFPKPFTAGKHPSPQLGSQGIAVSPARSGGETLLLVNSHQPLAGPVAWYEARLKSENGWDMVGGTFPGAPLILHGAGKHIGWSSTVNKPDLSDVYRLQINPENDNEYWLDDAWVAFEQRTFDITVHFFGPIRWTFEETVKISVFGPVLETDSGAFALNWAGKDEIKGLEAHYAMNRATDLLEFEDAISMGVLPSINYVVADSAGNIAHYYNAMFPKRIVDDVDWSGIVDGTDSSLAWQDYLPFASMPKTVNPSSGAVYNANNTPFEATDGNDGFAREQLELYIGVEEQMTNRAHRIKWLLQQHDKIDYDVFRKIKYDTYYDVESDVIKSLNAFLGSPEAQSVPDNMLDYKQAYIEGISMLQYWDLNTDLNNTSAALGVLTITPFIQAELQGDSPPSMKDSFSDAVKHLMKHFGVLNPKYADVNKLYRGQMSWPIAGGPDVLRAVYGHPPNNKGELVNIAGDSYILFARWDEKGAFSATSVHSFGSATLDDDSPHFDDQSPLFVEQEEKHIELDRAELLKAATSTTTFGNYR